MTTTRVQIKADIATFPGVRFMTMRGDALQASG